MHKMWTDCFCIVVYVVLNFDNIGLQQSDGMHRPTVI